MMMEGGGSWSSGRDAAGTFLATDIPTTALPNEIINDTCMCYPVYVEGHMYNRVIAQYLSECLYTVRDFISFGVGMSSILFWILCQMPQLISNCRSKSVAALSIWFLLQWMAGDLMNLVGCYLTGQLLTQKATAMLYIVMDTIVIVQYVYYAKCHKKKDKDADGEALRDPVEDGENDDGEGDEESPRERRLTYDGVRDGQYGEREWSEYGESTDPGPAGQQGRTTNSNRTADVDVDVRANSNSLTTKLLAVVLPLSLVFPFLAVASLSSDANPGVGASSSSTGHILSGAEGSTGRQLLWFTGTAGLHAHAPPACVNISDVPQSAQYIGLAIGWISAVVYLCSRVPQVVKNVRRGSVEGLSILMFICTVMGNLTYGCGIMIHATAWSDIIAALPWLVGSLGTLAFDATILIQFCYFRRKKPKRPLHLDKESNAPRGVHGIVDWAASPWKTPPVTNVDGQPTATGKDLRRQLLGDKAKAKAGKALDPVASTEGAVADRRHLPRRVSM